MIRKQLQIKNPQGLHARPAALFCKAATAFDSEIKLSKDGIEVNGKSVMGVMMLAAEYESIIDVIIDGQDEADAWDALSQLVERNFDE